MKRLVAYSSVSHMGFVTAGLFTFNQQGIEGSVLQMVNHGVLTGALFMMVGFFYDRTHTRMIKDYGGMGQACRWRPPSSVCSYSAAWVCPG